MGMDRPRRRFDLCGSGPVPESLAFGFFGGCDFAMSTPDGLRVSTMRCREQRQPTNGACTYRAEHSADSSSETVGRQFDVHARLAAFEPSWPATIRF